MLDIEALLQRYGLNEQFAAQKALLIVNDLLPTRLRPYVTAIHLRRGVLTLGVASSSVAQELRYLSERLIHDLNEHLGKEGVRRFRFRSISAGPVPPMTVPLLAPSSPASESEAAFDHVADRPLRNAFVALYTMARARQKALQERGGKSCPACGVVFIGDGKLCPGCRFDPIEGSVGED